MKLEEKVEISKIIIQSALDRYPKIFATCSFGKDSRVIVDLVMSIDPKTRFIGIDTGYEFEEIMQFSKDLTEETGMNFQWVSPSMEEKEKIEDLYAGSQIKNDQYICCAMKLPAIISVIHEYDAWITGLRRDETNFRNDLRIFEMGTTIKVNPIAFWTYNDVWQYIKENNLSYCSLYDAGYLSLGCSLCTKKGGRKESGVSERAGRFQDSSSDKKECGLHLNKANTE